MAASSLQAANTLEVELDFEDGKLKTWVPDGPNNRQAGSMRLPFDDEVGLPAILKLLNVGGFRSHDYYQPEVDYLRSNSYVSSAEAGAIEPSAVPDLRQRLGMAFFESLFPTEEMRRLFENAYRSRDSVHVQLSFRAESPALGGLPWELLYHDTDFLFGGGRGTLSRHLAYSQLQYPRPPIEVDRLRVLLIAPRPPGVADLGWGEPEALLGVPELDVDLLKPATLEGLSVYLRDHRKQKAPHVIHFDGHGGYGRRCTICGYITPRVLDTCRTPRCPGSMVGLMAQGYLALEKEGGGINFVSAETLANMIGLIAREQECALRVVVVSACRSGAATGGSAFSGIAQRLIKAKVPAVVAMQLEVRADTSAKFAQALYQSIAQNDPLPTALGWARTLIGGLEDDQWFRPVLYLGAGDNREGQFFKFGSGVPFIIAEPKPPAPPARFEPVDSAEGLITPIRRGLSRLEGLATARTELADALVRHTSNFQDVAHQLQTLGDYKNLHDQLHELYYECYAPARDQLAALEESPSVVAGFIAYQRSAESRIANLNELASQVAGRVEPETLAWIADLEEIDLGFKASLEARDRPGITKAVRRLGRLLMRQSAQINVSIFSTAAGVHLERVTQAMNNAGGDVVVAAGAVAVEALRVRLDALVGEHNRWQALEPDLQDLARYLATNMQAFVDDWPGVRKRVLQLCENQAEFMVQKLVTACSQVDQVLNLGVADEIWTGTDEQLRVLMTTYAACEFAAGQRFVRVDKDLKALCEELHGLRGPLMDVASALMETPV
jgi:hypothetical protein